MVKHTTNTKEHKGVNLYDLNTNYLDIKKHIKDNNYVPADEGEKIWHDKLNKNEREILDACNSSIKINQKYKKTEYEFSREKSISIYRRTFGRGGTGVVNLAIDQHSGFPVAIKSLFNQHHTEEMINKFRIEANIYLMLSHPNIVGLKDFIMDNNGIHLVMEYIDGVTLDDYI